MAHLDHILVFLLFGELLLEIVLLVVLEIGLEYELLSSVVGWDLFQIVALELLRSS